MYGIYYKKPLNFKDIIEKKDLEKTNLEKSIMQYIDLIVTTSFGECKFQELFGCKVWEMDFDLLSDDNSLRDRIKNNIKDALKMHEGRLEVTEIVVTIGVGRVAALSNSYRVKKGVVALINGFIKKTNRPFVYKSEFYLGPLSYV
ncbi:lysozyme [Apibacter muscae]|uniref:GPW/gp25 family protein n=1 Tax=Apibacter muscae TaxID=2509004 RepID=UPI0011AC3746|nr:GPW/gp25 family protein [Apibacter muscae]TWP24074.1 lysozyme [Apibacter muscae]